MKRTALFLTLLISILKFSAAQPSLGILSNSIVVTPDTVTFNQSITIQYSVVNTGNQPFNGMLTVYFEVNNNNNDINALDSFNTNIQIDTGQSFLVIDSDHIVTQPLYEVGDNIVVIWPIAINQNVVTTDSGTTHIYVDTVLGIGSPAIREKIKVTYRRSDQHLIVDYGDLVNQIKDVTAYSILGEQSMRYNYAVNEISFAESTQEIFLLVIRTKQGEVISFKILRL